MNNNNVNKNKIIDAAVRASGGKIDKNAVLKGDTSALLSTLSKADQEKIKSVLSDPDKTRNLLGSDAARAIMEFLQNGGKNNG